MISVVFDPDARAEFCHPSSTMRIAKLVWDVVFASRLSTPYRKLSMRHSTFVYSTRLSGDIFCPSSHFFIYSIEPDHIRIIAVAHTKRKPEYWLYRTE